MRTNKTIVAMVVASLALILLIAWGFYQTLQMDSERKIKLDSPQKSVMAQAQAMSQARFNELALSGKVGVGMKAEHVRQAFGAPARLEEVEQDGQQLTVWWYEHEGWMSVVFDNNGLVSRIEKQP